MMEELCLSRYISSVNLKIDKIKPTPVYTHMGAIVVDTVLQSGLNYKNIVLPRVKNIIQRYASFSTIREFHDLILILGLQHIINFNNNRKNNLINDLIKLFIENDVDNVNDLKEWLTNEENILILNNMNGIGNKTIDYMKKLVGIDSIAIDRHLINFLKMAEIKCNKYQDIRNIYINTAKTINSNLISLDYAVWNYMVNRAV